MQVIDLVIGQEEKYWVGQAQSTLWSMLGVIQKILMIGMRLVILVGLLMNCCLTSSVWRLGSMEAIIIEVMMGL